MRPVSATVLPLCAALGYAFAALMLKRATEKGVGPWRVSFLTNWIAAAFFAPWWFADSLPATWMNVAHAVTCGLAFFVGQIFTFLAIARGDVSVATPVLGTKVIFVAIFAAALAGEKLTPAVWFAAVITAVATALLGGDSKRGAKHVALSLAFGFAAAASFALTDSLQQRWIRFWGFGHFAATMFLSIGVLSFGLIPFFSAPLHAMPAASWRWALAGGAMLSVQATGMAYSIATFHEVTVTNILYNTRGIWSVILVWVIGHWFENVEREHGTRVMLRRLLGPALRHRAVFLSVF
jgi:drug/metabolite transporter (DMT)-like permease